MEFRNRYPHIFPRYATVCDRRLFQPGSLMLFKEPGHWILLFPTKVHWKDLAELEYVESGLAAFRRTYTKKGITSVAFPKLGCGLGGLDWNDARRSISAICRLTWKCMSELERSPICL